MGVIIPYGLHKPLHLVDWQPGKQRERKTETGQPIFVPGLLLA